MKGQVSTELLIIVALVLLIFIPLLVLVYFKANEANQQIASYQAELAVFRVAYLANSIGSLGTNTSVTTDVYVPKSIKNFSVKNAGNGAEISMNVDTPDGPSDIVEVIKYPTYEAKEIILADESNAGGWMRITVSSHYDLGKASISFEKQK